MSNSIKRGSWCPKCGGSSKLTIREMYQIAKERGGKCISKKYINNKTKLMWECSEKHQWKAIPKDIKKGKWCPTCSIRTRAEKQRLNIDDMRVIAEGRGGKCLSKIYVNIHKKLKWECSEGHQWYAVPDIVKNRGSWCHICRKKSKS